MSRGPRTPPIILTAEEREQLEAFAASRSLPHGLVRRAKIILKCAEGVPNTQIGKELECHHATVYLWRSRFNQYRLEGLYDEVRPGRPRTISEEKIAELIRKTLTDKPRNAKQWSCRSFSQQSDISKSTVQRIWNTFSIKPHRYKNFKISNDPFFIEKVRDIVGLYLSPPTNAIVLCVDEKSQCQALERSQPMLPLGLGYLQGVTHDYIRHGTTTLFSALNIQNGKVLHKCKSSHRHQEYLQFLRYIDANVPKDMSVHIIADNYATHKHEKVMRWFARNPRFHIHFTPTYSSWINQVERWFAKISNNLIRRGSFVSVKELTENIDEFVKNYNENSKPFIWTATADSIFEKLGNLMIEISGTEH